MRRSMSTAIQRMGTRMTIPPSLIHPAHAPLHHSQVRCMGIGRMIDMGGMPSGSTDNSYIRTVDASKNSKLKAVAFDFETLTTTKDEQEEEGDHAFRRKSTASSTELLHSSAVQPDVSRIEQVASLLNMEVPGSSSSSQSSSAAAAAASEPTRTRLPNEDIRAKYARKLKGGIAGIELSKNQVENAIAKGDAPGHLTARQMAIQSGSSSSSSRWMAMSGTGTILSYLSHRSIKLALLPNPNKHLASKNDEEEDEDDQLQSMRSLKRQLKDVVIDCIVDPTKLSIPTNRKSDQGHQILLEQQLLKDFDGVHPNAILVVSDKDHYLKAAKELGMLTCRLRAPNARRGNVSAHYTIPELAEVQEVVNEINGISFNAILNR